MKRVYQKPDMTVVRIQQHSIICTSPVTSVNSGDAGITYGGGNNEDARVKSNTVDWDDWGE